ncbi:MAG TPA: glycosyltransferase [Mucilaginibacter sp.]|jgi:glycosyltransferase involved in cell wall biosynthesis
MKEFPPYTIHHIYLNNSLAMPELDVVEKGNYLIFWWREIGLGQFFIEPGKPISENEYFEQLITAIKPTLEFYLGDSDITGTEWEYWLTQQVFDAWSNWMEVILAKFSPAKIPATVPVSVIICTRNRASHLQKCLTTLKGLVCLAEEIVVVDNAPVDDSTKNIAEKFEGVKYVAEPQAGLDIARNTGILNTTLPVIAYVDDDVIVHPWWAYNVWKTFQNPSIAAMTGLVIASELATEAQLIFEKHWSFNRGYVDKLYDSNYFESTLSKGPAVWEIGAGANMAFRKSIFEKTGFFNELLDAGAAGCNGDSEMWFRVLAEGFTICYNPRAVVYHEHRREMGGLKKQIFYYMRGFTTAALIQQQLFPESGYVARLKGLVHYYRFLIISGFPSYSFQYQTIWGEMRGILSGFRFFNKNKDRVLKSTPFPPKSVTHSVSVIIPCFNHGQYLMDALNSIWQQNYPMVEIIVVDDGSTDNTKEILKEVEGIKYIYQENRGLSAARNTGIKNSNGEFLIFLDADDWLLPGAIRANIDYLKQDKTLAFVSGAHEKVFVDIGESKDEFQEAGTNHYIQLLQGNYIGMHAAVTYSRWVFNDFLFDENLKACEDYDLYLKISRKYPVFHHSNKIAAYRIHNSNMSGNIPKMLFYVLKVLKRQKTNLRNIEEKRAYKNGLKVWKNYYCLELYNKLQYNTLPLKGNDIFTLFKFETVLGLKIILKKTIRA